MRFITLLTLALLVSSAAIAGPYEEGLLAFHRKNYQSALALWRPLAEQGNVEVQTSIGNLYETGLLGKPDWAEATKWYRKAADQGFAGAQLNLGWMYEKGHGVNKDSAEAFRWFRMSAEQGQVAAQNQIGQMYEEGDGIKKDPEEAYFWYSLAGAPYCDRVEKHLTPAQVKAVNLRVLNRYKEAAEKGNAEAQANMGVLYLQGKVVSLDYDEAMKWLRKSADQGNSRAQDAIEKMYEKGVGVKQDYAEAYFWRLLTTNPGDEGTNNILANTLTAEQKAAEEKRAQKWKPILAPVKTEAK